MLFTVNSEAIKRSGREMDDIQNAGHSNFEVGADMDRIMQVFRDTGFN